MFGTFATFLGLGALGSGMAINDAYKNGYQKGLHSSSEVDLVSIYERKIEELKGESLATELARSCLEAGLDGCKKGDSQRTVFNYKVDKGEELPVLKEFSCRINKRFNNSFTPLDLIAWATVGLIALVCFGLWFASQRRKIRK